MPTHAAWWLFGLVLGLVLGGLGVFLAAGIAVIRDERRAKDRPKSAEAQRREDLHLIEQATYVTLHHYALDRNYNPELVAHLQQVIEQPWFQDIERRVHAATISGELARAIRTISSARNAGG